MLKSLLAWTQAQADNHFQESFMNLLELMQSKGFRPKKVSSTNGGEYHSPCPACGGTDRFSIRIGKNRYYCRQCKRRGDAIQFLREFDGYSFADAASVTGHSSLLIHSSNNSYNIRDISLWQKAAERFVLSRQEALLRNSAALDILSRRGLNLESIQRYGLGWQGSDQWHDPVEWGFSSDAKKVYLPAGVTIPTIEDKKISKLKIRRSGWHSEDKFPKYLEVRGGLQKTTLIGRNEALPSMVLESELDAILMAQAAGDICNYLALGGATKRPDENSSHFLNNCPWIFFTLDYDEAGIASYQWWKSQFPQLVIWVPPTGKSPGDAYHSGIDLRRWLQIGIDMMQR